MPVSVFPVTFIRNVSRHCQLSLGAQICLCLRTTELQKLKPHNLRIALLNFWADENQVWIYIESEKHFYSLGFTLELRNGLWPICLQCLGRSLSALPSSGFSPRPHGVCLLFMAGFCLGFWSVPESTCILGSKHHPNPWFFDQLLLWVGSCSLHKSLLPELLLKSGGSLLLLGFLAKIKCKSSSSWGSHCAAALTVH